MRGAGICREGASYALLFRWASDCERSRPRVRRGLYLLISTILENCLGGELKETLRHTPQAIDSPLLKLLQCYIGCRRNGIEIQSMLVFLILVGWCLELFLAIVDIVPSLGINACKALPDHLHSLHFATFRLALRSLWVFCNVEASLEVRVGDVEEE